MTDDACDLLCLNLSLAEQIREGLDHDLAATAAQEAKALSDPTRVASAMALQAGEELCVCDLAWILGRAENLVSHHVRTLRQAGLAKSRRDGKMVLYSLTEKGSRLLETLTAESQVTPQ